MKTLYYSDQDFEQFMARSEYSHKVRFYVSLICSIIVQSGIWYVLRTDSHLSFFSQGFLIMVSLIALVCLVGLWYCWISARRYRQAYEKMKQEQQEEAHTLLTDVEKERQKKLNQDL